MNEIQIKKTMKRFISKDNIFIEAKRSRSEFTDEERNKIIKECVEKLISPTELSQRYNISVQFIRNLVKNAGHKLPSRYNTGVPNVTKYSFTEEQRNAIIKECVCDLITPAELAVRHKVSVQAIRNLVKGAGYMLPTHTQFNRLFNSIVKKPTVKQSKTENSNALSTNANTSIEGLPKHLSNSNESPQTLKEVINSTELSQFQRDDVEKIIKTEIRLEPEEAGINSSQFSEDTEAKSSDKSEKEKVSEESEHDFHLISEIKIEYQDLESTPSSSFVVMPQNKPGVSNQKQINSPKSIEGFSKRLSNELTQSRTELLLVKKEIETKIKLEPEEVDVDFSQFSEETEAKNNVKNGKETFSEESEHDIHIKSEIKIEYQDLDSILTSSFGNNSKQA